MNNKIDVREDFVKAAAIFNLLIFGLVILNVIFPVVMKMYGFLTAALITITIIYDCIAIIFLLQLKKEDKKDLVKEGKRSTQDGVKL